MAGFFPDESLYGNIFGSDASLSAFCGVSRQNDSDIPRPDVMYEKIAADTMMDPWQQAPNSSRGDGRPKRRFRCSVCQGAVSITQDDHFFE